MTLRPAAALKKERATKTRRQNQSSHDRALDRATKEIEGANSAGRRNVFCLTFPDSVVRELVRKGYKVTLWPALGMGDVDSHEISW